MKWLVVFAMLAATASAQCQKDLYGPCGDSKAANCCAAGYCQPWNSGYYQCIDKPSKCPTQETDVDYYGNDLKTIYGLQPDKCCDACATTPNCKGYTFVNENPDGKTACYLKSAMAGRTQKKGAVSGTIAETQPPQPPAKCPLQEIGYDYVGYDIKSVMGISQGDCCEECSKTVYCTTYTWTERGYDGRSACYLKSADSGRVAKPGFISGVLKEVPPPPDCPAPEYNTDYYGNDLKALIGVTQGECCDECGKTPSCIAYTFIPQDTNGKSACYLKWSMSGRRGRTGAIGNRRKDPSVPGNCPKLEENTDFYGNDLKKIVSIPLNQCCDECGKTAQCAAFTYTAQDSTCYLKTSGSGRTNKPGVVSGEVKCSTPVLGQCGSSSTGPLCCPDGAYCQPWNPAYYQCIPKPENAKCPTVVTGMDFYGGDLEVKYGLQPSGCCEACFNNKDCHVFTFINFNTNGQSACYLKSQLVEQRPRADAVSGYKVKQ